MNDLLKKAKRTFVRWVYYFFFWLFSILPLKLIFTVSHGLVAIAYFLVMNMRKIAKESLTTAFGKEKSEGEINRIMRACFFNLGRGTIEMFCYVQRPQLILEKLHLTLGSLENLENAMKEDKGVVGVSAHFGNFVLMMVYLSRLGYPVHAMVRPGRDVEIERRFQVLRSNMGIKTILSYPRETCVRQSLKALRAKEMVIILMDQNTGGKSGVFVDFFGKKAGTPIGAVIFAMRTGSPILPMFTIRNGKDSHKVIIEPHFYLDKKPTDQETLHYNVQKITSIIEGYVRKYPEEWSWMHRRWKSRPNEE